MKNVILTIIVAVFTLTAIAHADTNISVNNTNNVVTTGGQASANRPGDIGEVLQNIKTTKDKLSECKQYGYKNLQLRHNLVAKNYMAFNLTQDKEYLKAVAFNANVAENNFIKGSDIQQRLSEALDIMKDTYLYWRDCIKELQGEKAAQEFARAKGI